MTDTTFAAAVILDVQAALAEQFGADLLHNRNAWGGFDFIVAGSPTAVRLAADDTEVLLFAFAGEGGATLAHARFTNIPAALIAPVAAGFLR